MSRQNKVNPGTYTQRGRLTQDDAARELRKQSAVASPRAWQPADMKTKLRLAPAGDAARDKGRAEDNETRSKAPSRGEKTSTVGETRAGASKRTLRARARSSQEKTGRAKPSTAKTAKATATAKKRVMTRPTRIAVLARSAGGLKVGTRASAKRRKS